MAKVTKAAIESLDFQALPHPAYFPGLDPSDFHFFPPLQTFLRDKNLENEEEVKMPSSNDINFCQRGIHCLVEEWKDVSSLNGKYLIE